MTQTTLMREAASVVHHNEGEQLLTVENHEFVSGSDYEALAHWHEDLELIRVKSGEMCCHVNEQNFILHAGDMFFINRRQMHRSHPVGQRTCKYTVMLINPRAMARDNFLYENYLSSMISDESFSQRLFSGGGRAAEMCMISDKLLELDTDRPAAWEIDTMAYIMQMSRRIYLEYSMEGACMNDRTDPDAAIQRNMIRYIYENFSNKITLDEIADAGGVSRSKCCRVFKQYLQQSPVDFLNLYRLEVSCRLLKDTKESIAAVSRSCGFGQQSYFNRLFMRKYDCTPGEYRHSYSG